MLGASLDGSLLDDATWRARHRYVVLCGAVLTLFILALLADRSQAGGVGLQPVRQHWRCRCQRFKPGRAVSREVLVAVCFMAAQLYLARFVGNFTLGPLMMIVLSFYQDWVPLPSAAWRRSRWRSWPGSDPAFVQRCRGAREPVLQVLG